MISKQTCLSVPVTLCLMLCFSGFLFNFASVATNTAYKMKDTVKETVEKQVCV